MAAPTIAEILQNAKGLIKNGGYPFSSDSNHQLIKRTLHEVMGKVRIYINIHAHHHLCQHLFATDRAHLHDGSLIRKWVVYVFNGPDYFEDKLSQHLAIWLRDENGALKFAVTFETDFNKFKPAQKTKFEDFTKSNLEKTLMKAFKRLKRGRSLKQA